MGEALLIYIAIVSTFCLTILLYLAWQKQGKGTFKLRLRKLGDEEKT